MGLWKWAWRCLVKSTKSLVFNEQLGKATKAGSVRFAKELKKQIYRFTHGSKVSCHANIRLMDYNLPVLLLTPRRGRSWNSPKTGTLPAWFGMRIYKRHTLVSIVDSRQPKSFLNCFNKVVSHFSTVCCWLWNKVIISGYPSKDPKFYKQLQAVRSAKTENKLIVMSISSNNFC